MTLLKLFLALIVVVVGFVFAQHFLAGESPTLSQIAVSGAVLVVSALLFYLLIRNKRSPKPDSKRKGVAQ